MTEKDKIDELIHKYSTHHIGTDNGSIDIYATSEDIKNALEEYSQWNEHYKEAFDYDEKWLDVLWSTLYGSEPVADTGNYWNCTPAIVSRVLRDMKKYKDDLRAANATIYAIVILLLLGLITILVSIL